MTKYDKALRVIYSCRTLEQLKVARRYISLALPDTKERPLYLALMFHLLSREDMLKSIY